MTQNNPSFLFLKRLIVFTHQSKTAYDESFHQGINIIRGQNSSGKSTIANLIFYALGGDYNNWTTQALKCREVVAEVSINGAVLTLKRLISSNLSQPMSIYWGGYEKAKKDAFNWETYPYRQSDLKSSFTNIIFNALNFPEIKSDTDSNITMHQILRLLYIDQDSSLQCLFRQEKFDLPLTREAISEMLLGLYDDTLYHDRLKLKNDKKTLNQNKSQLNAIIRIYRKTGIPVDNKKLQKLIYKEIVKLQKLDDSITKLRDTPPQKATKKTPLKSEEIQKELIIEKNNIKKLQEKANFIKIDIIDSEQFISTLEKRILELNYAMRTREVLGELPLTNCPKCLTEIASPNNTHSCSLCKEPLDKETEKANAKRLTQEMILQVKESKELLKEKKDSYTKVISEISISSQQARVLQNKFNESVNTVQTTRNEKLDSLLVKKGGLEKEIENLYEKAETIKFLEKLEQDIQKLSVEIRKLKSSIRDKENNKYIKRDKAMALIIKNTLSILKNDLERQDEFKYGKEVDINFLKDSYTLDGGNNFSASSKTYFKNAVLFSIFFASLELNFFRYPRFILCDNMEDKGMEKIRTQNFQNLITELSDNASSDHQIIFTTSMISDKLNNTEYCVGEYYSANNKTLKV